MRYSEADALHETALECECANEALAEKDRLLERARSVAAQMEAELAALRALIATGQSISPASDAVWSRCRSALREFVKTGSLSDSAFLLASRLSSPVSGQEHQ